MGKTIFVSDFDGTITTKDTLYTFFEKYATDEWTIVEEQWKEGKISSKECLIKEFSLVPNLSETLINEFISTIEIDSGFINFNKKRIEKGIDFIVVSDGCDYFINKVLSANGISDFKIISNHGEFANGKFKMSFPNDYVGCKNDAGTCKCKVLNDLRKEYDKIYYIGDGVSDFCVAGKADILYAKGNLLKHCRDINMDCIPFNTFGDITLTNL